jgi:hypothetical protein
MQDLMIQYINLGEILQGKNGLLFLINYHDLRENSRKVPIFYLSCGLDYYLACDLIVIICDLHTIKPEITNSTIDN